MSQNFCLSCQLVCLVQDVPRDNCCDFMFSVGRSERYFLPGWDGGGGGAGLSGPAQGGVRADGVEGLQRILLGDLLRPPRKVGGELSW